MNNYNKILVVTMMAFALIMRVINVVPNFSPVVGLTLFGAALLWRKWLAIVLPLAFIYVSDFVINNTFARPFFPDVEGVVWFSDYMIWNFIAYGLIAAIGVLSLRSKLSFKKSIVVTLGSSILFFIISNFGSFVSPTSIYPDGFSGLMLCYEAALPFFRTSLLADLGWSVILFGSYFLIKNKYPFVLGLQEEIK